MLGKGSNTLIDPDANKTFVQLSAHITEPSVDGNRLRINAATPVAHLLQVAQSHGLSGLEFCAGVPAGVGGMVFMNFGCWGQEIAQFIHRVRAITNEGEDLWLSTADLQFGYRRSLFHQKNWIIVEAEFSCVPDSPDAIKNRIRENIQTRLAKQPLRDKTFGSIFKNPDGHFAAALLEKLGYKGYQANGIKLSEQHSNFLVNVSDASYKEALIFIDRLIHDVKEKIGIQLELEVRLAS